MPVVPGLKVMRQCLWDVFVFQYLLQRYPAIDGWMGDDGRGSFNDEYAHSGENTRSLIR